MPVNEIADFFGGIFIIIVAPKLNNHWQTISILYQIRDVSQISALMIPTIAIVLDLVFF